jgi:hypothetical protein
MRFHVRFFLTATRGGIYHVARGVPILFIFHKLFIRSILSGTYLYTIQDEYSYKYDFSFRILRPMSGRAAWFSKWLDKLPNPLSAGFTSMVSWNGLDLPGGEPWRFAFNGQ